MKITLTNDTKAGTYDLTDIEGSMTLTIDAPAPISAPAPPTPAPPPPAPVTTLVPATVTGTVNGTAVSMTVQPGQRAQLVPGNFQLGSVMYYADGCVVIENSYVGAENPAPIDLPLSLTIAVGSQTFTTDTVTLWYLCWTRPFWIVSPAVKPFDASLFPTYGSGSASASYVASYAKGDNSILGIGTFPVSIGNPGEHDYLGLLNAWDADYIVNPSADAAAVVRGMSDAANPWPFHAIDTKTGQMLLASDWPKASMLPACYGPNNPFVKFTTTCPYNLGQADGHAPSWHVFASALFGTEFDKAALSQWTNYVCCLWQNPGYRVNGGPNSVLHAEGARGVAWPTRQLAQAAKLSAHPALFDGWLHVSLAELTANLQAQTGAMPMLNVNTRYPKGAFAPWQMHMLVQSLGYCIQLGYSDAQAALDMLSTAVLDSILVTQHEFATIYEAGYWKDAAATQPVANWQESLQLSALNAPTTVGVAVKCAEDSQALRTAMAEPDAMALGDFDGHPASPTGYPSIMQPALAMLADHATDQVRARAAWTKFVQHNRADYSQQPKYNIVPKAA